MTRAQDAADGVALRRLREALPEGYDLTVSFTWGSHGCEIDLWRHGFPKWTVQAQGPTVAEASKAILATMNVSDSRVTR